MRQDLPTERIHHHFDDKVIHLRIHDRWNGYGAASGTVELLDGRLAQRICAAYHPGQFGKTTSRPKAETVLNESALQMVSGFGFEGE